MKYASPNHQINDLNFQPVPHCPVQNASKQKNQISLDGEIVTLKDQPTNFYDSLDSHCKVLSQSLNLDESLISEIECHNLENEGVGSHGNVESICNELIAILRSGGKGRGR